ncbi:MAG: type II toxin-antitoxin system HicB family antitoxin [Rhodospirillales bacterium]|nr:type II toxin-antitoxin system HicB family antitoxin [Rhodospirillales bacterium]
MEKRYEYAADFTPDENGDIVVTFPDVPEAITGGEDFADALAQAEDCLSEAIQSRINDGEAIPESSAPGVGQVLVPVEITTALKAAVVERMKAQGVKQVQLAQAMRVDGREVRRLLAPKHRTKVGALELAMRVLGGKVTLVVEDGETDGALKA